MNLMTTDEAAKKLYTTPYTIRKYIRQGKIIASRIGKNYLIDEAEINRLLNEYRTAN